MATTLVFSNGGEDMQGQAIGMRIIDRDELDA
jgi:hypothetical protein